MATARDRIKRAMRLIGVYSIGEEPSADEMQDGLTSLNAMLESFATDSQVVYVPTLDSIPWSPATSSYTVGPTGTFVTERPIELLPSCYYEYGGVSYPLTPLTVNQYNAILLKSLSTIPQYIWCNPTYPNSTITLYPTPSQAVTLKLWSTKALLDIPDVDTVIDLPPGYTDFIDFNLAESLAPEYEVAVPAAVAKKAMLSRKTLARLNYIPPRMRYPSQSLQRRTQFNIYSGQPL